MPRRNWLPLFALLCAPLACFEPAPAEGLPCSAEGECPTGLACDPISLTCVTEPRAPCQAPEQACNDSCVNYDNDNANCGMCGNECPTEQRCAAGQCLDECPVELLDCNGVCIDGQKDDSNCGACGNECDPDNEECRAGSCELRCDLFLDAAVQDSWGAHWDGLVHAQADYATAEALCSAHGGRLPTVTELYRVSQAHSGEVGDASSTEYLWTIVPANATSQEVVRLSDGITTYAAYSSTSAFRCVCPEDRPESFRGASCYGEPGQECSALSAAGGRYQIDSLDRPVASVAAAVWECAFQGGHVARVWQLADAIKSGAAGSNNFVHTAQPSRYDRLAMLRWTSQSWLPATDMSFTTTVASLRFRCAGVNYGGGTYAQTLSGEYIGGTYKADGSDRSAASLTAARDDCWASGGHLATRAELVELIQQGLPSGSDTLMWTADELGYNTADTQMWTATLKWADVQPRFAAAYSADVGWVSKTGADAPYRCVYYPVDTEYTGPAAMDCSSGCFELELPGGTAKVWFDTTDRSAALLGDAYDACRSVGGRLPTERDYFEAIRAGLPNGSGELLWTDDFMHGNQSGNYQGQAVWTGVQTTWDGLYDLTTPRFFQTTLDDTQPFRCMWTNELR